MPEDDDAPEGVGQVFAVVFCAFAAIPIGIWYLVWGPRSAPPLGREDAMPPVSRSRREPAHVLRMDGKPYEPE